MGICEYGECPQSKLFKDVCCLDCENVKLCLGKGYTCIEAKMILIDETIINCEKYMKEEV